MFLPRVIPLLLLKDKGLVKTTKYKKPKYIGDPINAVRIFNDLKTDELIFLDITSSKENRCVSTDVVKAIGDEAFMPFGVGGGISTLKQVEEILISGAEKVVINTQTVINPRLISEAAKHFGNQSIVVSIDVKKNIWGRYEVWIKDGTHNTKRDPIIHAMSVEGLGAGEIFINSIDKDGMMEGYDIDLVKLISDSVSIPVIACGGAGNLEHLREVYFNGKAQAMAAGSMFVFHGPRRAVLINYPDKSDLLKIFDN